MNDSDLKGKTVRVVKGRKIPIGIQGKVLGETVSTYGYGNVLTRLAIAVSDELRVDGTYKHVVWVNKKNVAVL